MMGANERQDGAASTPCIEGFFCKIRPDPDLLLRTIESVRSADASDKDEKLKELESLLSDTVEVIDPHQEAQELRMLLNRGRNFFFSIHPQPTFQDFSDCMRNASRRNVRNLHFSGHGKSRWGFFWLKPRALEYDNIPMEKFVRLFETEVAGAPASSPAHGRGTVECVFLNACHTEDLGKKLREAGVPHVVCWRSEVYDSTASKFTIEFYASFEENKNYKLAFRHAVNRMDWGGGAARAPQRHLARGAVDYVCLLSIDGNEFPETGHIRDDTQSLPVENDGDAQEILQGSEEDAGDAVRNWRKPRNATDYAALAGRAERECMVLLGFQMTLHGDRSPIRVGKGIEPNGFITDQRVFAMWGVRNYTSGVWGSTKKAVEEAKKLLSSPEGESKVSQAILKLKEVEDCRKEDMKMHGVVCAAHRNQLQQIEATRRALEALKSTFNLSALAHALPTAAAATRSAPEGIELAFSVVEEQSGVDTRQSPTDSKLRRLGNFKMQPTENDVGSLEREVTADLRALLGEFRVQDEAERLAKNGVCSIEDVPYMTREDVEKFKLRLIFREILRNLQQRALEVCLQKVAHPMCSREPSPTPSDRSGMHTPPQSPLPPSDEVIGIHVESTVSAFRDDMKKFIQDFLHQRRLCELLLVAFMRDKVAPTCDAEIAENLETWQEKCEDLDANLVNSFNKIMLSLKPSILKEQLSYEFSDGNKKNHTSVFVIDWMVQHSPWALNKSKKADWIDEVVKDFDPNNADSAEDFLERAEDFLQKGVKGEKWGIKILGKVIETNSYVAFFRMEALAALLLREYCKQQQILHAHQQMQLDSEETAPKSSSTWPLAITLMVSSSNWHLPFTDADDPGSVHVSEIVGRLRRIACLPSEVLEDNECSLDKAAFVEWEPLYNLKGKREGRGDFLAFWRLRWSKQWPITSCRCNQGL